MVAHPKGIIVGKPDGSIDVLDPSSLSCLGSLSDIGHPSAVLCVHVNDNTIYSTSDRVI
eukprot:COSAG01_NODE_69568_length_261_cov_0.623457_1_plen_58_part_01